MDYLSLKKAVNTAVVMDTAPKDAAELQSLTANVKKVEKRKCLKSVEHRPRHKPTNTSSTRGQKEHVFTGQACILTDYGQLSKDRVPVLMEYFIILSSRKNRGTVFEKWIKNFVNVMFCIDKN
jgi:hypothetical protein